MRARTTPRRVTTIGAVLAATAALGAPVAAAAGPPAAPAVRVGVGQADITPPTGSPLGGWVRADRLGRGVHTRLMAKAIVLERGGTKVALVSVDLFAAVGGLVKEVADRTADRGFSERNVVVSASHTHAGPSGFANFSTLNTVAPSPATIGNPSSFVEFLDPKPTDRRLYTFLAQRIALALRQADRDLGPARVGWGSATLPDVTKNRSIEAHLADHGQILARGQGRPELDPDGVLHTIDPDVDVLRVDRLVRRSTPCTRQGRRTRCRRTVAVPIGGWLMFANHGTVNPSSYQYYNQDHHGPATRVFEREVRRRGKVPAARAVVGVYGNGNEGDQSAGLDEQGPEHAEEVGRAEAAAMLRAWSAAGRSMTTRPALDLRWTRVCFCGQDSSAGPTSAQPIPGLPFLTGSEEGRGPLFDLTGIPLEDQRSPVEDGFAGHGHKIAVPASSTDSYPNGAPLFTVRVRDRIIASLPGEPTVETGRRVRQRILDAIGGAGVRRVIVAGLTNEFFQYFVTPEEYARQHYEGGSQIYGTNASVLLTDALVALARNLTGRGEAPQPYDFDPRNGVVADGEPYPTGATDGRMLAQPPDGRRGGQTVPFSWQGGPGGYDKPLDTAFLTVERRVAGRWRTVSDDRWIDLRWQVDDAGRHRGEWLVPRGADAGTHRIRITANGYALTTSPFALVR
ncbi:neutral/alkaline non-lysosomal ceramidase N-terminal domain-containing protein [Conexibacter sp. W3-3-2]|uniref:neutral/alkaline non-lysosomal ceramidase N-terminal domain-containing protein n=1 Tax=Conexibacter sp. W3-3-2 TaxID=2675227 RepID=UPI0018AA82C6|nr:neutral/alkaline non-lysosomal ceramidase N-terminal domain-containing protein [Conexibacter sp. W3-3-2]